MNPGMWRAICPPTQKAPHSCVSMNPFRVIAVAHFEAKADVLRRVSPDEERGGATDSCQWGSTEGFKRGQVGGDRLRIQYEAMLFGKQYGREDEGKDTQE